MAAALDLVQAEDLTAEQAAERVGLGGNTVRRALKAPTAAAKPEPLRAAEILAPPTDKDRQVDALIATSRTWRRVCEALARFAAAHPTVAGALAAELRGLNL